MIYYSSLLSLVISVMLSASLSVSAAAPTSAINSNGWDPGKGVSTWVGLICTSFLALYIYLRAAATAALVLSSNNDLVTYLSVDTFSGTTACFGDVSKGFVDFYIDKSVFFSGSGTLFVAFLFSTTPLETSPKQAVVPEKVSTDK
jgi:hypothetical protein